MVKVSPHEIPLFSLYIKAEPGNRIQRGNLHFHRLLLPPTHLPPYPPPTTLPIHPQRSPPLTQRDHCRPLTLALNCNRLPHMLTHLPWHTSHVHLSRIHSKSAQQKSTQAQWVEIIFGPTSTLILWFYRITQGETHQQIKGPRLCHWLQLQIPYFTVTCWSGSYCKRDKKCRNIFSRVKRKT